MSRSSLALMVISILSPAVRGAWQVRNAKSASALLRMSSVASPAESSDQKIPDAQFPIARVPIKRNRQSKSFRDGSQLVFSGSIDESFSKSLPMASLVQVEVSTTTKDNKVRHQTIGWGCYNPLSLYRIRLLCHANLPGQALTKSIKSAIQTSEAEDLERTILSTITTARFQQAMDLRQGLGLGKNPNTDTYRLVHGEGDQLSGLAVDIIGNKVAVCMSSAAWCEVHRDLIIDSLKSVLPETYDIVWRTTPLRLKQDGWQAGDRTDADKSESERSVLSLENGIKYQTYPYDVSGQKTGVYCDQRENRKWIAELCEGKRVLDLCCYHGGFALNAAVNGNAKRVVAVDSSQDAIDACHVNAELNGVADDRIEFVRADISDFMKDCQEEFDVVILDPPKLAPTASTLDKAIRKYKTLNRDALKLVSKDGGFLLTCTCSAAMTQANGGIQFLQMVQQAGLSAQRIVTLTEVRGAAPCHVTAPASVPAGNYLTAALFRVHKNE